MTDKAWVLTERRRDGKDRIEGIALTNAAASAWVHNDDLEFGQARTSSPHPIIDPPALPDVRPLREAWDAVNEFEQQRGVGYWNIADANALEARLIREVGKYLAALPPRPPDQET